MSNNMLSNLNVFLEISKNPPTDSVVTGVLLHIIN